MGILIVIDADCILANLLQTSEQVTTRDLNRVRTAIEKEVPSVYVDVTRDCIIWAVNRNPDMFSSRDNVIKRMKKWTEEYVDETFNWRIPENIRKIVLKKLKEKGD